MNTECVQLPACSKLMVQELPKKTLKQLRNSKNLWIVAHEQGGAKLRRHVIPGELFAQV